MFLSFLELLYQGFVLVKNFCQARWSLKKFSRSIFSDIELIILEKQGRLIQKHYQTNKWLIVNVGFLISKSLIF